jgi:hypothetical protein
MKFDFDESRYFKQYSVSEYEIKSMYDVIQKNIKNNNDKKQ